MASPSSVLALALLAAACGDDPTDDTNTPAATVAFELDGELAGLTFWDLPFPSDLRLDADGSPALAGFPNPAALQIVRDLAVLADARRGFSTISTTWLRFTGDAPPLAVTDVIAASPDAPILLVDIDVTSPAYLQLVPLVAQTLAPDPFTTAFRDPGAIVAIAPRPGIVLRGDTRYAVILTRALAPTVEVPPAFAELAAGSTPAGARGADAVATYAPLWPALADLGLVPADVLVATVFTTGDEVALLRARSEAIRASTTAAITELHVEPGTPATRDGFCVLAGTVTLPEYQIGVAPFVTAGGGFELDATGVPVVQSTLAVPLRITLPSRAMPAAGWPLWQYFHGSGGASFDIVDEGPTRVAETPPTAGLGPGAVVAHHGIATAAAALPVNPERIPGADAQAYLQLSNLGAFPYTFQQGVFEQRLLLDALLALAIDPARLAADCPEVTLPAGATAHHFDPTTLTAGGHSMGGMYANMIGAVEPRFGALTPFGAGGFWSLMILDTETVPGARYLLAALLELDAEPLAFTHPVLGLLGLGWEIAEPGASMARLARRPLPGAPPRHVYQPIGLDDRYFPNAVFDAAALAYGNHQAGHEVWPGTQAALALDGSAGLRDYPLRANRASTATTSVVVQYADDGIVDAHQIYRQLDAVKAQYGCFLATYIATGIPTVVAPDGICPTPGHTRLHKE